MSVKELVRNEDVQALVARGQEHGFLSFEEVAQSVESLDMDGSAAEDLYKHLDELGIELVEVDEARKRQAKLTEESDKPPRRLNLKTDTSTDSLQLFLKDVGRVPLLTAAPDLQPGLDGDQLCRDA